MEWVLIASRLTELFTLDHLRILNVIYGKVDMQEEMGEKASVYYCLKLRIHGRFLPRDVNGNGDNFS